MNTLITLIVSSHFFCLKCTEAALFVAVDSENLRWTDSDVFELKICWRCQRDRLLCFQCWENLD